MAFRILVIPGNADGAGVKLSLNTEIALLANLSNAKGKHLEVEIVLDTETSELDLVRKLVNQTEPYDCLHFLGHSSQGSFVLANGQLLTPAKMHSLFIDGQCKVAFLNACSTATLGQYLVNNGVQLAVCYATDVLDSQAILVAVRFYSALSRMDLPYSGGLRRAFDVSKPDDGTLLWLSADHSLEVIKPVTEQVMLLETRTREFLEVVEPQILRLDNYLLTYGDTIIENLKVFEKFHTDLKSTIMKMYVAVIVLSCLLSGFVFLVAWIFSNLIRGNGS